MQWADAVKAIALEVEAVLAATDESIPVYLGAYAATPNADAIYVWRSRPLPKPPGLCDLVAMVVMVEVWIRTLRNVQTGLTERELVNQQVHEGWLRHARIIDLLRGMALEGGGMYATCKATHPDNGEFYPMVGEAIELHVNYDNKG